MLTATDVEGDALTFTVVSAPAHGVVIITNPTTGAYSYTPAAEYLGADSFTFRAADAGSSSNVATVRLTSITPVNDAPVATSVVISTQEAVSQSGMLFGTDIDGPALIFSVVTAPAKGTLTLNNPVTGAFTYTPNVGALGYDTFTFQVADGAGGSSSATGMVFIVAASPRWPGQTIRASVAMAARRELAPVMGRCRRARMDDSLRSSRCARTWLPATPTERAMCSFSIARPVRQHA